MKDFKALLKEWENDRPEHVLFRYYEKEQIISVTVRQWIRDIWAVAAKMAESGLCGKNVGLDGKNSYEWFVFFWAMVLSGNTAVSVNTDLEEGEVSELCRLTDVSRIFVKEETREHFSPEFAYPLVPMEAYRKQALETGQDVTSFPRCLGEEDTALILFSSGTSGKSKGVMLSQKNLLSVLESQSATLLGGDFLLSLPLYHVGGVQFSLLYMCFPATVCISLSAKYLLRDVKIFRPSVMCVVPMQLDFMAGKCGKDEELSKTLEWFCKAIVSVGAPLVSEHEEVFEPLGISIWNGYGLTETSGFINEWIPHKRGTLGGMSDRNQVRVIDGEIAVRGDSVMKGYYGDEQATKQVFRDGWFFTGDLADIDEEGFFVLRGRKKNIIILGNGENVCPEEIEEKLLKIKEIKEAVVYEADSAITASLYVGKEDREQKQEIVKEKIRELNNGTPAYRRIRRIQFVSEPFEKTGSGKIRRL